MPSVATLAYGESTVGDQMGEVINFKWCQLRGCIFGLSLGEWVTPIMGDTRRELPTYQVLWLVAGVHLIWGSQKACWEGAIISPILQ